MSWMLNWIVAGALLWAGWLVFSGEMSFWEAIEIGLMVLLGVTIAVMIGAVIWSVRKEGVSKFGVAMFSFWAIICIQAWHPVSSSFFSVFMLSVVGAWLVTVIAPYFLKIRSGQISPVDDRSGRVYPDDFDMDGDSDGE